MKILPYQRCRAMLGNNKNEMKLHSGVKLERLPASTGMGEVFVISYNSIEIVKCYADGDIILNTGGKRTQSTQHYINEGLDGIANVTIRDGHWLLSLAGEVIVQPFRDGIMFNALTGKLRRKDYDAPIIEPDFDNYTLKDAQALGQIKHLIRAVYKDLIELKKVYPDSIEAREVQHELAVLMQEAAIRHLLPSQF